MPGPKPLDIHQSQQYNWIAAPLIRGDSADAITENGINDPLDVVGEPVTVRGSLLTTLEDQDGGGALE